MLEPIILASGSLRRQEYFRLLGLPFSIMPSPVDEGEEESREPRERAEKLAVRKVTRIIELLKGQSPPWVCGADTVLSVDGEVFGKPRDREDARRMLELLQGRSHEVISAVALYSGRKQRADCRSVASSVSFAPLSERELEWYLDTGEWQGMAGSYRIQGLAGCFVRESQGSFSSIVGLPLHELYVMLRENGYAYGEPD
jgi:septum formation protein